MIGRAWPRTKDAIDYGSKLGLCCGIAQKEELRRVDGTLDTVLESFIEGFVKSRGGFGRVLGMSVMVLLETFNVTVDECVGMV
jgi:DNA phosphorothioation-dependent restriction protein DptG